MSKFPMLDRCDKKAKTMPHFTIVASDPLCEGLIRTWAHDMALKGVNTAKLDEAYRIANEVADWREKNPERCKLPD